MTKVLIIDDSTELVKIFSILLNNHKYKVETAPSKNQGLDKLSIFKPDVIVLAVLLEGQAGSFFCFCQAKKSAGHM